MANSTWANARMEAHETLAQVMLPVMIFAGLNPERDLPAGYTLQYAEGMWTDAAGATYSEAVVTLTMSGHDQPIREALRAIIDFAFTAGEQAVYVVIDGKAYIYHRQ